MDTSRERYDASCSHDEFLIHITLAMIDEDMLPYVQKDKIKN